MADKNPFLALCKIMISSLDNSVAVLLAGVREYYGVFKILILTLISPILLRKVVLWLQPFQAAISIEVFTGRAGKLSGLIHQFLGSKTPQTLEKWGIFPEIPLHLQECDAIIGA